MAPAFDAIIVQYTHNFFLSAPFLKWGAVAINYAALAALVVLVAWVVYKKRNALTFMLFLLVPALAYLASIAGKFLWDRPRPFVTLAFQPFIGVAPHTLSFPSSHATVAFALATVVYVYNKKIGRAAFVVAGVVALARIAVGVHYPTDILAGALLGVVTSYLTVTLWKMWSS